ncbi:MAG: hypothetical protein ACR2F6_12655 [Mycobacteriales bacterium]
MYTNVSLTHPLDDYREVLQRAEATRLARRMLSERREQRRIQRAATTRTRTSYRRLRIA